VGGAVVATELVAPLEGLEGAEADPGDWFTACAQLIHAALALAAGSPEAAARAARLDSIALASPALSDDARSVYSLLAARLLEATGQTDLALAAVRRVDGMTAGAMLAPAWLFRARLARDVGLREEALEHYRRYLRLRPNPDPGSVAASNVEAARRELEALIGEG
jgi:tetratricopeptide (TPR) repeat protein